MTSLPLMAAPHQPDRDVRRAHDHLLDLNLTALEQQFFVEWEVPQADASGDAVSA